uniref:Uncharacterized protein n=2 Tax=Arundo donax TaxID=35708 RepID=A0A0A8XRS7_ARUDO
MRCIIKTAKSTSTGLNISYNSEQLSDNKNSNKSASVTSGTDRAEDARGIWTRWEPTMLAWEVEQEPPWRTELETEIFLPEDLTAPSRWYEYGHAAADDQELTAPPRESSPSHRLQP